MRVVVHFRDQLYILLHLKMVFRNQIIIVYLEIRWPVNLIVVYVPVITSLFNKNFSFVVHTL